MKNFKMVGAVLAGAAFSLLTGCAAMQETVADASATQFAEAPPVKCRAVDAPTGSSIPRRDCSNKSAAVSMDAEELMGSKRFFVAPDPSAGKGK